MPLHKIFLRVPRRKILYMYLKRILLSHIVKCLGLPPCQFANFFTNIHMCGGLEIALDVETFYAIVRRDWQYGAYPPFEHLTELQNVCLCDGMFSELFACGSYYEDKYMFLPRISVDLVCVEVVMFNSSMQ